MTEETSKKKNYEKVITLLLILGLLLAVSNQLQLMNIVNHNSNLATGVSFAVAKVIPTGAPDIYGTVLGISYSDINPNNPQLADKTIEVMANLDRTLNLEGENLERYISITSQISCEYCCGVQSIIVRQEDVDDQDSRIQVAIEAGQITEDQAQQYKMVAGDAACGCAHSYAMRGLAKYLITEHGDEFSDDEILTELSKWKTLYFPGQMSAKAQVLEDKGIEFSYINLGSNKYRDIEKGTSSGSGMVGGC